MLKTLGLVVIALVVLGTGSELSSLRAQKHNGCRVILERAKSALRDVDDSIWVKTAARAHEQATKAIVDYLTCEDESK